MHEGSRRAILARLGANLGIAVAKFVGFALTGAASLLAEAVHSVADSSNQGLLLLGSTRAKRTASESHPFGYGRETYFWSFVVALVLFSLGGVFAIVEGWDKLRHPHEVDGIATAVVILALAMALETFSLATAVRETNHVRGDASWWQFIRHSKRPDLPIVLLEDVGAEIGLALALTGVVTARITGNARWDAAGSLGIGELLVIVAGVLVVEMKSLLIGESASAADERAIKEAIGTAAGVRGVIHLRTQHLGPDERPLAASID